MARQPQVASISEMRILAGLALQPVVTGGVAFLLFPVLESGGGPASATDAALSMALAVGIVCVPVMLIGVLPVLLWLRRRDGVTLARAVVAGVLAGNMPLVIGYLTAGTQGSSQTAHAVAYASGIGLASAAVFWLVISPAHHEPPA